MAKKAWVKVKRGLINDPKHREAMGEAIWLYLHILDRTNYEDGAVYEWRDSGEAEILEMSVATLRKQRKRLEEAGYIKTEKQQHKQLITVSKWVDPCGNGSQSNHTRTLSQSNHQSDHRRTLSESQSDRQSNRQSDHTRRPVSIITHDISNHEETDSRIADTEPAPKVSKKAPRDSRLDHPAIQVVRDIVGRYTPKTGWDDIIEFLGAEFDEPKLRRCGVAWARVSTNMGNLTWLFEWYRHGIPERARANGGRASPVEKVDRIRKSHDVFLERHGVSEDEDERRFDSIQQNDFRPRSYV